MPERKQHLGQTAVNQLTFAYAQPADWSLPICRANQKVESRTENQPIQFSNFVLNSTFTSRNVRTTYTD